jgi:hydroxyethylthiazole kinase
VFFPLTFKTEGQMQHIPGVWEDVQKIRAEAPLVHNITNYVVMNSSANALLALGASPVMAHALEEVEEMTSLARALVLNIGTLSAPWVEAMLRAGAAARTREIPVVLDPVGAGATRYRTETARRLLAEVAPTIVRGNPSEIRALASAEARTKGVDSTHGSEEAVEAARALARAHLCVVSVSGVVDVIVSASATVRVANGHPLMGRVTGLGCAATAITGAFAAVNPDSLMAAAHAMAVMGVCGEIAEEHSRGPGSFQVQFMDALSLMTELDLTRRVRLEAA